MHANIAQRVSAEMQTAVIACDGWKRYAPKIERERHTAGMVESVATHRAYRFFHRYTFSLLAAVLRRDDVRRFSCVLRAFRFAVGNLYVQTIKMQQARNSAKFCNVLVIIAEIVQTPKNSSTFAA